MGKGRLAAAAAREAGAKGRAAAVMVAAERARAVAERVGAATEKAAVARAVAQRARPMEGYQAVCNFHSRSRGTWRSPRKLHSSLRTWQVYPRRRRIVRLHPAHRREGRCCRAL